MEWLKNSLGDAFTDEIAYKIQKEIEKQFVPIEKYRLRIREKQQAEQEISEQKLKYEQLLQEQKAENMIMMALVSVKAKNLRAVRALLNIDIQKLKLNEEGIQLVSNQIELLKNSEKTAFLFEQEQVKPVFYGLEPIEQKDGFPQSDPQNMTYSQMCDYFNSYPTQNP